MPGQLTFQLIGDRPVINVEVKPSLAWQHSMSANTPFNVPSATVPFLVDTGAAACILEDGVISAWGLRKTNPFLVRSGTRPTTLGYRYDLSLRLHTSSSGDSWLHGIVPVTTVPAGEFGQEPFKGIIGMDILRLGRLQFDGPTSVFSLWW